MVFLVIRCSTLRRHNHLIIPLISVNDGSTNTGVRVDPSDYQYLGTQRPQNFLKLCTKECAIAFLDYHCIYRLHFEFAENLRPFRASYGDTYVVLSHFKKGVA